MTCAWPLPALLSWASAWAVFVALGGLNAATAVPCLGACTVGGIASVCAGTTWRRVFIAAGFPLSLAASGLAGHVPGWVWLLPLALLALMYPIGTWRDAPLFPTPSGALRGMASLLPLPPDASIVDAGCGLGDGLRELHAEYPQAAIHGLEWSRPLAWLSARRCAFATVQRADIWAVDWSGYDLVYLFQRPESMPRAIAKAVQELRPGAWLASLEFEAAGLVPKAVHRCADGRPVWLYRLPFKARG